MNNYVTGAVIRQLREGARLTQSQLAERLSVSDKTISKWETGRGLPDISLLEPLAECLGISVPELLSGQQIRNKNKSGNVLRGKFYVCPVCGNVLLSTGEAMLSCCGVSLPPLEAEPADEFHSCVTEAVEDEILVTVPHEMTKSHYISFLCRVTSDRAELVKLYPEGPAQARFRRQGTGRLYWYCNRHGLFWRSLSTTPKG